MESTKNDPQGNQVITMYAPIFREKLQKLERRGQGHSTEAMSLRKTLALVEQAQTPSSQEATQRIHLVATR